MCVKQITYHLEKREEAVENIIKIYIRIPPSVFLRKAQTFCFVWNKAGW